MSFFLTFQNEFVLYDRTNLLYLLEEVRRESLSLDVFGEGKEEGSDMKEEGEEEEGEDDEEEDMEMVDFDASKAKYNLLYRLHQYGSVEEKEDEEESRKKRRKKGNASEVHIHTFTPHHRHDREGRSQEEEEETAEASLLFTHIFQDRLNGHTISSTGQSSPSSFLSQQQLRPPSTLSPSSASLAMNSNLNQFFRYLRSVDVISSVDEDDEEDGLFLDVNNGDSHAPQTSLPESIQEIQTISQSIKFKNNQSLETTASSKRRRSRNNSSFGMSQGIKGGHSGNMKGIKEQGTEQGDGKEMEEELAKEEIFEEVDWRLPSNLEGVSLDKMNASFIPEGQARKKKSEDKKKNKKGKKGANKEDGLAQRGIQPLQEEKHDDQERNEDRKQQKKKKKKKAKRNQTSNPFLK
jgi:hypothetical protein